MLGREKMYKRRRRWRKVTNSMWSLLVAVVVIIVLVLSGSMCGKYVKFMNREGLPSGDVR